ncbi:MAG: M28 family peptidase [Polyangiaceae bacterium]|nr:M28 family peptidase [Polyangiaceae bacterium]
MNESRQRLVWWRPIAIALGLTLALAATFYFVCVSMPGSTYADAPPALDAAQLETKARLSTDLQELAVAIGERHDGLPRAYRRALEMIEGRLASAGWEPVREPFDGGGPEPSNNVVAEMRGDDPTWIVIGAHYDTARGSPGANDNGTGVVALLELARRLRSTPESRSLRLVFFANEEPPHFEKATMGSRAHAKAAAQRGETIAAMISLETMGFFSEAEESQKYPAPFELFYPTRGNFLGFIGNLDSRSLVRKSVGTFREHAKLPAEGAAIFESIPGVGWSDHASFWAEGVPALMVTDTAPFRYPHYHTSSDTPDQVDFDRLTLAVDGLDAVVRTLLHAEAR